MISAFNNGVAGMQAFSQRLDNTMGNIARNSSRLSSADAATSTSATTGTPATLSSITEQGSSSDLTNDMVDMMAYQRGFEMNAQMVKTGNEMMGTLLNTFA